MIDVQSFFVNENQTVLEVMELLDKLARKIMFITSDSKLIATLTDGDIRRWILKNGSLNALVKNVANYNPKFLCESERSKANSIMKKYAIEAIPIVDDEKRITSVVLWNDEIINSNKILDIPVIIMAGGFGTRLYPYTKILPKPLIPIGEIPIAEHIINNFCRYGCSDFHLIVNHKKNMIKAYFNEIEKDYCVSYVDEDIPLGTGGGLSLLKDEIKSTFILSNCDILIDEDYSKIHKHHKKENNIITMVCSLKKITIPYGVVDINNEGVMEKMREKPALTFFVNTGVYIVEPRVAYEIEENTKIGFPDIIQRYKDEGEKIGVYPISENSWMDMGHLDEMEKMRIRLEDE